ncbi:MAG: atoC [Chlamydiales bacterium]|jgi:two-component system response regulator AtoC|nr:atoC [Chlamydiales bacterium]
MGIEKILIVDDELLIRNFLAETLRRKQFDVEVAENGQVAFNKLKAQTFDLVITDMKMPDITGIDVLRRVKEISPSTLVIIVTAFGSIENAVEAMRIGAFNYLIKPFSPDTIEAIIEKAQEHSSLVAENSYLRQEISSGGPRSLQRVIGESPVMKQIISDVVRVAKSNASVFINGESGTGKEVISHLIHQHSYRVNKPYIRVNCAALPESLIESELFGHEKGAFTGANNKRLGRFELAHTGTLLLDEVTEIPIVIQAKLLRVIQEQEFDRVGGMRPIKVDVRLVATSNRNMQQAIEEKVFREDLYYRLNVVPINLPPLRDRRDDIIPLAEYFLEQMCIENHKDRKKLSLQAKQKLLDYPWPGNIRELANIIERAVVMDFSNNIAAEHLYIEQKVLKQDSSKSNHVQKLSIEDTNKLNLPAGITLQELEKQMIIETLELQDYHKTKTAEALGVSLRTLRNKMQEHGLANKSEDN